MISHINFMLFFILFYHFFSPFLAPNILSLSLLPCSPPLESIDYNMSSQVDLTLNGMETLSVSIQIIIDSIAEKTEMFSVMLRTSSQRRGISLSPAKANITIVDDDSERRRRVDYIEEGREGGRE